MSFSEIALSTISLALDIVEIRDLLAKGVTKALAMESINNEKLIQFVINFIVPMEYWKKKNFKNCQKHKTVQSVINLLILII